ncbi:hypothetical protein HHK36_023108 [Tetracentron sinense]|uniref:Uncharacterized protein n=1 Tax=Tetracentron sinense TaxID=13715 RepID=A0A834YKQ2_TETSI|nr:hypothetical protein HHK36_023108 [Tetracentron sinense]
MNAVNQSTKTTIKGNKTSSILNTIGLKDFQSSTEIDALSGINCLKSVGSMTMSTRDDAIRKFTVDPNYKIILMSLKAGGVALNLAVASHSDQWCGSCLLEQGFKTLFRLSSNKSASIVDLYARRAGVVVWNLSFSCPFNDWEVRDFASLLTLLESAGIVETARDRRVWATNSSGIGSRRQLRVCEAF